MSTNRATTYSKETLEERDYWVAKLSAERPVSNLITDYERPDFYTDEKETVELVLSPETSQKLAALTGNSALPVYAVLLTALKVCLHQHTKSPLITVGSPALKNGLFQRTNALPIISQINDQISFRELSVQVQDALLQAYSKQTYPVESLLRDMELDHIQNRCALFDVALALKELHCSMPDVKNDITITFDREGGGMTGQVEFNGNLFSRESITNFGNHYLQVLNLGLESADAPISCLTALTDKERHQILVEWNDTASEPAGEETINLLFEEQANRSPEAIAITFGSEHISYRELNRQANKLAHYLKSLGVGPEVPVGIYFNRSVEMVVSLLAVLKAGGGYVPMNPKHPKDRLSFILSDTRAAVVLTDEYFAQTLPEHGAIVVRPDLDKETISHQSDDNPSVALLPNNFAYVMYTSGSTGNPKGVQVTHKGLCNLAIEQARRFDVNAESRMLQFASLSFDASASEIFVTLLAGGTLCLAAQDELLPGACLMKLLRENAITCVTLPPSVLLATPKEEFPNLQTLIVAGEACPTKLVKVWCEEVRFLNAYGPTEATVCATIADCTSFERKPPIGRPIGNTQIFLLDSALEPVAKGVPGELYIAGMGLARGYMNRPDLTADKFLPNPFSTETGARFYASGDLTRYLPDGSVEFLGRIDYQVKLRGFRIEPGEIEETLRQHRSVCDAVVVAREDTPENKSLVAYVVSRTERQDEVQSEAQLVVELRNFLHEKLPEYMIPSAFVLLEDLPLTAHGKVDRRSLPAPQQTRSTLACEYVAPRTYREAVLADIWAQALGVEKVGIHDNFFELDGHSLMVPGVMFSIQKSLQIELPLRILFEAPTVAGLAEAIELAACEGIGALDRLDFGGVEEESVLDSKISPEGLPYRFTADSSGVFLTGSGDCSSPFGTQSRRIKRNSNEKAKPFRASKRHNH